MDAPLILTDCILSGIIFFVTIPISPPLRECFLSSRVSLENDQIQPNLPDRPQVYRMADN